MNDSVSVIASWKEYGVLLLDKLKNHKDELFKVSCQVDLVRREVSALQLRIVLYSAAGSSIPLLLFIIIEALRHKL